jgi:hypothetical protein
MVPVSWRLLLEGLSRVQKLVHLASRKVDDDADRIRVDILRVMRRAYEDELTIQAARVGCPGRRGQLTNGPILSRLNDTARTWANGIVNTYNRDLAAAIILIRAKAPRANRHVYAKRLRDWDEGRAKWKNAQIETHAEQTARSQAQQDFFQHNGHEGYAILRPKEAVCPVCLALVKRGKVPIAEAFHNPGPWHVNCPHRWVTFPGQWDEKSCPLLWMGGD